MCCHMMLTDEKTGIICYHLNNDYLFNSIEEMSKIVKFSSDATKISFLPIIFKVVKLVYD